MKFYFFYIHFTETQLILFSTPLLVNIIRVLKLTIVLKIERERHEM